MLYGDRLAEAQARIAAAKGPVVRSEFVQSVESNREYASGFEAAKLELARGNQAGAIRLVRETSGVSLAEAQELVGFCGKPL